MIKLKHILNEVISEDDVSGAADTNTSIPGESESDLENVFDDFEKEIKKVDLDAPESEGIGLTLAGVALSFGEISRLLGKFVNLISKIPRFKSLSGDRLIAFGEKFHHKIVGAFEKVIRLAGVKDATKAKKAAEILYAVTVAILLYNGVGGMADKFAKGSTGMGYLKGALNAVKGNEIGAFLKKAFVTLK